jgi:ribosomal protein S18 acetylase RimI-like enzyme
MNTYIPPDSTASAIAATIDANIAERMRYCGRTALASYQDSTAATLLSSGVAYPNPFLNLVFAKQFAPAGVREQVRQIESAVRRPGIPHYWALGATASPRDLGAYLEEYALTPSVNPERMAVSLRVLAAARPPAGLSIERVATREQLERFVGILAADRPTSTDVILRWVDYEASLGLEPDLRWQRYVGVLDGQPVATAALFLGVRSAGVYHVETLPMARGRGIATALVRAALLDARRSGYLLGTLHSTRRGVSIYRRLGFESYGEIAVYECSA